MSQKILMEPCDSKSWRVSRLIRARIGEGKEFGPGDLLPDTIALAAEYRISPNSILTALAYLVGEGLIYRRRGQGTWVKPKEEQ